MREPLIITLAKHRVLVFWGLVTLFTLPIVFDIWILFQFKTCTHDSNVLNHSFDTEIKRVGLVGNDIIITEENGFIHLVKDAEGVYDDTTKQFHFTE